MIGLIVIFGLIIGSQWLEFPLDTAREFLAQVKTGLGWEAALIGAFIYAVLLAVPFVPGVELAWLIILFFGRDAVVLIYFSTLLGLVLSFCFGRWIGVFCRPCKTRIDRFAIQYNELFYKLSAKIHGFLSQKQCALWLQSILNNSHYVMLAVLINIPGNSMVGGGGGISLLSGLNPTVSFKGFVITMAIAIAPLPILLFFGWIQVEKLLT